jgi:hypothetical protein
VEGWRCGRVEVVLWFLYGLREGGDEHGARLLGVGKGAKRAIEGSDPDFFGSDLLVERSLLPHFGIGV